MELSDNDLELIEGGLFDGIMNCKQLAENYRADSKEGMQTDSLRREYEELRARINKELNDRQAAKLLKAEE